MHEITGVLSFLSFMAFVAGVLGLILFFKIWGMTNDVKKILDLLANKQYDMSPRQNYQGYDMSRRQNPVTDNGIGQNQCIMMKGDTLNTNNGVFYYTGVYNGKHMLYPADQNTENVIWHVEGVCKDAYGKPYLGLSDMELQRLVDKYKK